MGTVQKGPYTVERRLLRRLLREIRDEAGLNQGELAERLEVPQSLVSRFERADRKMDLQELREVCLAVGIPLHELVRRFEEELAKEQTTSDRQQDMI